MRPLSFCVKTAGNRVCRIYSIKTIKDVTRPFRAREIAFMRVLSDGNPAFDICGKSSDMATTTINGIPVYRATLASERCGMKKISLVDAPAVQTDFLAFAEQEQPMRYAVQDEEKRLVAGVIMRANYPIYRYSKDTGAYYIMYAPETIREMAEKYLAEGRQNEVNLQHEDNSDVDGVNLVQWYIKDTAAGIAPAAFADIEDGSLFGEFHITNDEVWAGVKDGTYKGFSLEGIFGRQEVEDVISTEKMNNQNSSKMAKIMDLVRGAIASALEGVENSEEYKQTEQQPAEQEAFGSVATDRGVMRWEGDEALAVGNPVKMVAEDGAENAPEDGVYMTETHEIEVAGGVVKEIRDKVDASEQQPAEPVVETPVEETPAEPAEPAAPAEPEVVEKNAAQEIVARMAQSFEDKYRAIYDAFAAAGLDAWIVEAGDTFAVVELWNGEAWHYYRYSLSFGEDGAVTLGERVEVYPAFVTAEEKAEVESKYAALETENAALREQVADLEHKPAAAPAHDKFRSIAERGEVQSENAARVSSILNAK